MENSIFLIASPSGTIVLNPNEGDDKYYPDAFVIRNWFIDNLIKYYPVNDFTELIEEDLSDCMKNFSNKNEVINIINQEAIFRKSKVNSSSGT